MNELDWLQQRLSSKKFTSSSPEEELFFAILLNKYMNEDGISIESILRNGDYLTEDNFKILDKLVQLMWTFWHGMVVLEKYISSEPFFEKLLKEGYIKKEKIQGQNVYSGTARVKSLYESLYTEV